MLRTVLALALTTELLAGIGLAVGVSAAGSVALICGGLAVVVVPTVGLRRNASGTSARQVGGALAVAGVVTGILLIGAAVLHVPVFGAFVAPIGGLIAFGVVAARRQTSGERGGVERFLEPFSWFVPATDEKKRAKALVMWGGATSSLRSCARTSDCLCWLSPACLPVRQVIPSGSSSPH